jgi:hypothetical protein
MISFLFPQGPNKEIYKKNNTVGDQILGKDVLEVQIPPLSIYKLNQLLLTYGNSI